MFSAVANCIPSFKSMDEKEKVKVVLSCTDSDESKICIQGVYKMFLLGQTLLQ